MKQNYLLILLIFFLFSCATDSMEENTPEPDAAILKACFEMSEETVLAGETLQISSCSKGATEFLYDFGNGDASTLENPEVVFTEAGEYTITLTVTNEEGDSKSFSLEVTVVSNESFYFYPETTEGFSSIPLELGINPNTGKWYYIELHEDKVGTGGAKFYYRELSEDLSSERQYLADKPYNSNSAFVNFYPSGKQNFVFSRTLNGLYGTQEITYDASWAFLNGIQSAKKHSYGALEVEGTYLYFGTDKSGDFNEAAIELRNSNGDAFQVFATAIPEHENATIGDMIAVEGGYVAFGGVFKANMTLPYVSDYYPLLLFYDNAYTLTSYMVYEDSALTGMINSGDSLNGSFHMEKLDNGNLVMYAMGELRITDAAGSTLYTQYFENTPNNQGLVCLGDSFVISTRDYLKKFDPTGKQMTELKYGGQYLPEIIEKENTLFFIAGYEDGDRIKTFYGSSDLNLNLIPVLEEPIE